MCKRQSASEWAAGGGERERRSGAAGHNYVRTGTAQHARLHVAMWKRSFDFAEEYTRTKY